MNRRKTDRSLYYRRIVLLLLAIPLLVARVSAEENWPRFRGPGGRAVAADHPKLPTTWNQTENVAWVSEVPGWGWASPVVWGDKVFVSTVVADQDARQPSKGLYLGEGVREPSQGIHHWLVLCYDLKTGRELWRHEAQAGRPQVPRHPKSTYAAETPATDGKRLYVLFGDLGLYCYSLDGALLWSRSIEPKKTAADYGAAASPVVHDGQVFVVYDNEEASWIASFDAETGEQRWRKSRDEKRSWATPLIWENELRTEIVVTGLNRNRSYSLDGELLWEFDGQMSTLVIPSPFSAHGMVYLASGYVGDSHRPTFAVKPGATGTIAASGEFGDSPYIEWYQPKASPYNTSQIVVGDYLYTVYDQGFITCHDAKTGEEVFGKKRFRGGASFTASPWSYNGKLFCLSEDGLTYVLEVGPEYRLLGTNALDELCIACPAVSEDKLIIRTASKLYCLTEGVRLDPEVAAKMQPNRRALSYSDIFTAVRQGNVREVTRLLQSGVSVNARQGGRGATPLNTAAIYGQTEVAKYLIDQGADVKLSNPDGNTALLIASFFCHTDMVDLLLSKGASPLVKNKKGESPLDVVSAPWSDSLASTYQSIGGATGQELDLEFIERTRPIISRKLRDAARQ